MNQRVNELVTLLQDLKEMHPPTHHQVFGTSAPNAIIDTSELIVTGHSFGGITALMTAHKLGSACKAVCVMDPWFYAYHEEFNSGEIAVPECPVQIISSEMFHPSIREYDSWETLRTFLKNSHKDRESIKVLRNGHLN